MNVENVNKKINKLPFSKFFVNFGQFPRNSGSVGKLRSKNELNLQPKEYDQGIGCWLLLPKLNLSREINRNLSNNSTNRPSRRCLIGKIELTESRPGTTLNLVTAQKQSDLSVCVTDRKSQYYGNAVCSLLKSKRLGKNLNYILGVNLMLNPTNTIKIVIRNPNSLNSLNSKISLKHIHSTTVGLTHCRVKPNSEPTKKAPKKSLRNPEPKKLKARSRAWRPLFEKPFLLFREKLNANHRKTIVKKLLLSGDIAENPGPGSGAGQGDKKTNGDLMVTSYNVRGLNDEAKLRHLVNHCYATLGGKDQDSIYAFQETYIPQPGKIPFLWRGNFHLTAGEGNKCGCLTLLSSHINVIDSRDLGNRAHVLVCQKSGEPNASLVLANIYAPNPNSNEKIDFFEEVFESISEFVERYDSNKVIIAGDYNLTFKPNESKNRLFTAQERRIANYVKDCNRTFDLTDLWETNSAFTWRRANSDCFSTIDRLAYSGETLTLLKKKVDWSLSMSDHAAVVACFNYKSGGGGSKSKITRLDPNLLQNLEMKVKIETELREMIGGMPQGWDPHIKLEFSKMCLRTVVEKAQAERKRREKSDEELVDEELNLAIISLANGVPGERDRLIDYVEELRARKAEMVDLKGKKLAEKLGTKWYNEGEKSNRYFLRLLRRTAPDKFSTLENNDGELIEDEKEIEETIVNFYKSLYEEYDKTELNANEDNSFFDNIQSLPDEDQQNVVRPITIEELKQTLNSCSDSAPGPDGIAYSYLRTFWDIFGPLITAAWNHSLCTGNLPTSHRVSFLKLIPKQGKNLNNLTNWRPITLSNCDHKIITKTYANRLCEKLSKVIKERQTAYLKGRLINDNVRAIIATIEAANLEQNLNAILTSLDAKKAFDSVEHSYIRECLRKFGLASFVGIFDVLYSDLQSDIIINGRIVKGFKIKRGVKQGDALSCILFIMCMEPLLSNLESNRNIKGVRSALAGEDLPKIYAFADDVNGLIANDATSLQEVFNEYGRLTNKSGLTLNADKTEIMPFSTEGYVEQDFEFIYLRVRHRIESKREIKVNGILLQQNMEAMGDSNVDQVCRKIHSQLLGWAARKLSLLGKILLMKTYGVSQIVYLMQSIILEPRHIKKINEILYKFLWNKRFLAAKAPDRITREIINTPLKLGGFGMLNIVDLDESLKLRALGRLTNTKHPFLEIVKRNLTHENFFFPEIKFKLEKIAMRGVELVAKDRQNLLTRDNLDGNRVYLELLKSTKIKAALNRNGLNSIIYFNLRLQRKLTLGDLNERELNSIKHFMCPALFEAVKRNQDIRLAQTGLPVEDLIIYGDKTYLLSKLSSKEIRTKRNQPDPICLFKLGAVASPSEAETWGMNLAKVNNVRHRNVVLKVAHGDVYTNLKLFRFRLKDTPRCSRCGMIENLKHKIMLCSYVREIWRHTFRLTDTLRVSIDQNEELPNKVLGLVTGTNPTLITIHAEILNRVHYLKNEADYTLHPKRIIRMALEFLTRREKKREFRSIIDDLLRRI